MTQIIVVGSVFLVFGIILYMSYVLPERGMTAKKSDLHTIIFAVLLAAGLIARYIGAGMYEGHSYDMSCFSAWSSRVFENGYKSFYSPEVFTDYPPGYMYVLWILGAVRSMFSMSEGAFYILLKTPAIVCDMVTAALLYRLAAKHMSGSAALAAAAVWIFNPAVFINSAVWGQVDSVYTLLVFICLLLLVEDKLIPSFFVFAAAVMIKPQSLFYTPVFIYAIIEQAIYPEYDAKKLLKYIVAGFGAALTLVVIALPFGLENVAGQYIDTLSSYPYCSVNAFNLWAAVGLNWIKLTPFTSAIGTLAIAAVVAASAVLFFRCKDKSKYFWIAGFICFSIFMLANKMHERYAYPAMLMLLAAFVMRQRTTSYAAYLAVAVTQFLNAAYALFFYDAGSYFSSSQKTVAVVFGFFGLAAYAIVLYATAQAYTGRSIEEQKTVKKHAKTAAGKRQIKVDTRFALNRSLINYRMTRKDAVVLVFLMAVYSGIALFNLGDMKAPQSGITLDNGSVSFNIDAADGISEMKLYLGAYNLKTDNILKVSLKDLQGAVTYEKELDSGSVFCWTEYDLENEAADCITLEATGKVMLLEAAFFDKDGGLVKPSEESGLFDEQELVPERKSFKNGTYFDEIYHARTAYEFIHKLPVFEWTHPPLGKIFISLGIRAFGMTPFGWRIAGTLFGIFMIPAIYLFAKKMFGKTSVTAFCAVLFTFDFMHFAQTRIATIDVYITFFIILMYLFMLIYYRMSFYDTDFKKTLIPLGLCGISFGLGAASKWTGLYAGAGLAVLFFICMAARYREYKYALEYPKGVTDGVAHEYIISVFPKYARNTILFCLVFFVAVPALIYTLSYLPFISANGTGFAGMIKNQSDMFNYHKGVTETHSFSSEWYKWPIMYRPIWYYSGTVSDTVKEGISSFGNPLVWWAGIPAFFYVAYCAFAKKDKSALFLTVGYLAELLPWIPVTRVTFIYHYFPCVPFVAMMLAYSAQMLIKNDKTRKRTMLVYAAAAVILFAMFYPVLSGWPVSVEYVRHFLKWSSQWVLVSGA